MFLLSPMDAQTTLLVVVDYLFVLGLGLGMSMQVLTIVVQNTVPYHDLGVATSGVTFLRTLGSAFGVALFGTVYSNSLQTQLEQVRAAAAGRSTRACWRARKACTALPVPMRQMVVGGYTEALQTVFLAAVPVGLLAAVIALFLKQVPLRDTARAAATDLGEGFSVPEGDNRDGAAGSGRSHGSGGSKGMAAAPQRARGGRGPRRPGARLVPFPGGAVRRVPGRPGCEDDRRPLPHAAGCAPARVRQCIEDGYLRYDGGDLKLTPRGIAEYDRISAAWRDWLAGELSDWGEIGDEEFTSALRKVAEQFVTEELTVAGHR